MQMQMQIGATTTTTTTTMAQDNLCANVGRQSRLDGNTWTVPSAVQCSEGVARIRTYAYNDYSTKITAPIASQIQAARHHIAARANKQQAVDTKQCARSHGQHIPSPKLQGQHRVATK